MADGATSSDPAVQRQLDRLAALSLPQGRLGLDAMHSLMARLDHPERRLPPVFHIAGTNGKGSTAAFVRAILEADGRCVHAYTSPHLVRFNERIRVAGSLIDDAALAPLLEEVLDLSGDFGASFFEITTAAAFLAFARTPADATIVEVGLGGRLDATNVLPRPAVTAIAALGIDHEAFLLAEEAGTPRDPLTRIAWEKAGIAKQHAPLVTQHYSAPMAAAIAGVAETTGAPLVARGGGWHAEVQAGLLHYRDQAGTLDLPVPALPGAHQADNAALAIAMLRHQDQLTVSAGAMERGLAAAHWPARLQKLGHGPLTDLVPQATVWLDGGHNSNAGEALGAFVRERLGPVHLIIGMLANKNPDALLAHLNGQLRSITVVPVPGHQSHDRGAYAAPDIPTASARDVAAALRTLGPETTDTILIAGSLYLSGDILRRNDMIPD